MTATRNLRILAIVGGILSLVMIGLSAHFVFSMIRSAEGNDWSSERDRFLSRMPHNELRADISILTSQSQTPYPEAYAERQRILDQSVREFPSSPRIQLRKGVFSKGEESVSALQKAATLDPGNALPLYLLAAKAAERKSWDEAIELLKRGNSCKYLTGYPIPDTGLPAHGVQNTLMISSLFVDISFGYYADLRQLARMVSAHAAEYQSQGQTSPALLLVDDVEKMGWMVANGEPRNSFEVLVGTAITRIALNTEKNILTKQGDRRGLARLQEERHETFYLTAGVKGYTNRIMDELFVRMRKFYTPAVAMSPLLLETWIAAIYFLSWIVTMARSRNKPANMLHPEAAELAFPMRRLCWIYLLISISGILVFPIASRKDFEVFGQDPVMVCVVVLSFLPVILAIWSERSYKKAFSNLTKRDGITAPKISGRRATAEERREFIGSQAGVHGGAMIFLLVWSLAISIWMKTNLGSYPWQVDYIVVGGIRSERTYIRDLLAHKIHVPESAIHTEEKKEEDAVRRRVSRYDMSPNRTLPNR